MAGVTGKSNIVDWFNRAGVGTHHPVKVIEVHWVPERKEWEVQARGVSDDGNDTGAWSSHTGSVEELADLLSLAHDTVTGG